MKPIIAAIFIFCLSTASANFSHNNGRIINGLDAARRQFPYQVSLQRLKDDEYEHVCGGSLISTKRVLTAAHCKVNTKSRAVFGMLIQNDDYLLPDVQISNVEHLIRHPRFGVPDQHMSVYDIMMLFLSSPVTISPAVQIVPLGTQNDCDAIEDVIVSGWGLTSSIPPISSKHLKYITQPRLAIKECKRFYPNLDNSNETRGAVLCTSVNKQIVRSPCTGDSGGPLTLKSNKRLIGITSFGPLPCESARAPTLYTSICKHREFISIYS